MFIARFSKEIILMRRSIISIPSLPVAIIPEYTPASDLLALLQKKLDNETDAEDVQGSVASTLLLRVAQRVTISPNTDASVSGPASSAELFYMAPNPSFMQSRVLLAISGIYMPYFTY